MMKKKVLAGFLIIFLLTDLSYSFLQHYNMPIDGDLAGGVVPAEEVNKILEDPFALKVLLENEKYANPNRYFIHYSLKAYFQSVPFVFQKITTPTESIYLSSALFKILVQIGFIFMLSAFIGRTFNVLKTSFLIPAAIFTCLVQTNGFQPYIGIIDKSITYTFFYALPLLFLLLFLYPILKNSAFNQNKVVKVLQVIVSSFLTIALPFSGALIPGLLIIFAIVYYGFEWKKAVVEQHDFKKFQMTMLLFSCVLSAYSLYVGFNNTIFQFEEMPSLTERYSRMPTGLWRIFTDKFVASIFILVTITNMFILLKFKSDIAAKKVLKALKLISIFSFLYLLLLPLGGYKNYRENIVRYDTFMPVMLCLFYLFIISSLVIVQKLKSTTQYAYILATVIVSIIYQISDAPNFNNNECEKQAIIEIAHSKEKNISLSSNCNVMSWNKFTDSSESRLNCELLYYWGVIDNPEKRYYFQ